MLAVLSRENDPAGTVAVGRNKCVPEDQIAVTESVLAVAGLDTYFPACT